MKKIKRLICPGCGKVEEKEEIYFLAEVIQGKAEEIKKAGVDGIKWCPICR